MRHELGGVVEGADRSRGPVRAPRQTRDGPGGAPARKGGEAYAKEWVNVLEESAPDHDPFNTYTWELKPEAAAVQPDAADAAAPGSARTAPPDDPFDSFTWEAPGNRFARRSLGPEARDAEEAAEGPAKKDGVNPYDTGVFDASWTGRFDQR